MTAKKRRKSRKKRTSPWALAAGALALAALIVGLIFLLTPARAPAKSAPQSWQAQLRPTGEKLSVVWSYRPVEYERPEGVDVLAPTWLYVEGENGAPVLRDLAQLGYQYDPKAYVNAAHADGAKVWVTVVSFTPELSAQVMEDESSRAVFAQAIAQWVKDAGADGVCFDFEKMNPEHKERFTALVSQTRSLLPEKKVCVAVTVPAGYRDPTNWYQCYDRASLALAADYLAVMTYDAHKEAQQPVSPVEWVSAALERMLTEVPSDQILMGVPFYGVDFTLDEQGGILSRQAVTVFQLEQLLLGQPITLGENTVTASTWITRGDWQDRYAMRTWQYTDTQGKQHKLWIEDEDSIAAKCALLKEYSLAGVAVWRQSQGNESLWAALARGIRTNTEE